MSQNCIKIVLELCQKYAFCKAQKRCKQQSINNQQSIDKQQLFVEPTIITLKIIKYSITLKLDAMLLMQLMNFNFLLKVFASLAVSPQYPLNKSFTFTKLSQIEHSSFFFHIHTLVPPFSIAHTPLLYAPTNPQKPYFHINIENGAYISNIIHLFLFIRANFLFLSDAKYRNIPINAILDLTRNLRLHSLIRSKFELARFL